MKTENYIYFQIMDKNGIAFKEFSNFRDTTFKLDKISGVSQRQLLKETEGMDSLRQFQNFFNKYQWAEYIFCHEYSFNHNGAKLTTYRQERGDKDIPVLLSVDSRENKDAPINIAFRGTLDKYNQHRELLEKFWEIIEQDGKLTPKRENEIADFFIPINFEISRAFINSLITQSITKDFLTFKPELITDFPDDSINQTEYKQPNYLTQITDKAITVPFTTHYTPEELDGETTISHSVQTIPNIDSNVETFVQLNNWLNNYDTFDLQLVEAWLTEKKENSNAKGIAILDICNDVYRSKSGEKLRSRDNFVKEVTQRIIRLTSTPIVIDFNQHLNYMIGKDNKDKKLKNKYKEYKKNGGAGIIKFNLIEARVKPIVKRNGTILDGLEMTPLDSTEIWLDKYLELTKGLKTIPEPLLISPLSATIENQKILRYLAGKLIQLPFNSNNLDLFNEKYKILQLEQDGVDTERLTKENTLKQNRRKTKDYTIRVDTLKKELKLKTANSRLTDKIEKILDYWKSNGYITSYETVYNKRSKEKYVIRVF